MARAEASVVINRPVKEVGDYLDDPANSLEWESALQELEMTSEGPIQLGSTYRGAVSFLGRRLELSGEITEFESYGRQKHRLTAGPLSLDRTEILEPLDGGTRFTIIVDVEPRGFFRLADPIVMRMLQRDLKGDLARLKDILEAEE